MRHTAVHRPERPGAPLAEQLTQRYSSKVEPITMTAPVKESLAARILAVFQRGELNIPDHRPLLEDLHSVTRTVTLSGNVRYAAPRESGSHADRWTALALALQAIHAAPPATTPRLEIIGRSVHDGWDRY